MLKKMREEKKYDHVLVKSDYWKKFEGILKKAITPVELFSGDVTVRARG